MTVIAIESERKITIFHIFVVIFHVPNNAKIYLWKGQE